MNIKAQTRSQFLILNFTIWPVRGLYKTAKRPNREISIRNWDRVLINAHINLRRDTSETSTVGIEGDKCPPLEISGLVKSPRPQIWTSSRPS